MDNAIARQVVTSPCVSSDTIARPLKARDALIPRQGRRSVAVAMVGYALRRGGTEIREHALLRAAILRVGDCKHLGNDGDQGSSRKDRILTAFDRAIAVRSSGLQPMA